MRPDQVAVHPTLPARPHESGETHEALNAVDPIELWTRVPVVYESAPQNATE